MVKALKWGMSYRVYCLGLWWRELPDRICRWLAHHIPKRLAFLAFVRVAVEASSTHSDRHPMGLTVEEIMASWEKAPQKGM